MVRTIMENDPWRSWKSCGKFLGKNYGNPGYVQFIVYFCVSTGF